MITCAKKFESILKVSRGSVDDLIIFQGTMSLMGLRLMRASKWRS